MDLQDKVAVVTGASAGLGLEFSKALIAKGAHVFGLARSKDRLDEIRDVLGDRFVPIECDVTKEDEVQAAFKTVKKEGKRLDVLVNNAGLGKFGPIDKLPLTEWDVQMETNLRGVFLCTREAIPAMKEQNEKTGFGGHIVNIASVAGLIGNPMIGAYNASKFGLRGFSEALMKEVREDGIKVSCIYPGSVETQFANTAGTSGSKNPMMPQDIAATVVHVIEAPDNYLISEVVMRPLRPKG